MRSEDVCTVQVQYVSGRERGEGRGRGQGGGKGPESEACRA